jgi:cell shape-determining protein MreC
VFLLGTLLTFDIAPPTKASAFAQYMAAPLWKTHNGINLFINDSLQSLKTKNTLVRENRELKEVIRQEQLKNEDRNLLYTENVTLKSLLSRIEPQDFILAKVLTRPNQSVYDTFVLDVGTLDGVREGDGVYAGGTLFVGKIVSSYIHTSVVSLLSSPNTKTNVIVGSDSVPAVAFGRGAGNFEIRIPREIDITKGSFVRLPGISISYIGVVEEVILESSDPFKKLLILSPINLFTLDSLLVEKSHND